MHYYPSGQNEKLDDCAEALKKARNFGIPEVLVTDEWNTYPWPSGRCLVYMGIARSCMSRHISSLSLSGIKEVSGSAITESRGSAHG
jgi:hypothetical protein